MSILGDEVPVPVDTRPGYPYSARGDFNVTNQCSRERYMKTKLLLCGALCLASFWNAGSVLAKDPVILPGALVVGASSPLGSGTSYDITYEEDGKVLSGLIALPSGSGPHPLLVVSHGKGSNAHGLSMDLARDWFLEAGYAVVAVDYTHAGNVQCTPEVACGGSAENVDRLLKAMDVAQSQQLIDALDADPINRDITMLYGNSMGAFVSIEAAVVLEGAIKAVVTTAGGLHDQYTTSTSSDVARIRAPVMVLHGRQDKTVPPIADETFIEALRTNDKEYQAVWFPAGGHGIVRNELTESTVRAFVLGWLGVMVDDANRPRINNVKFTSDNARVEVRGVNFSDNADGGGVLRLRNGVQRYVVPTSLWAPTQTGYVIRGTSPAGANDSGYTEVIMPVGPYAESIVEQPEDGTPYGDALGGARSNLRPYTKNP